MCVYVCLVERQRHKDTVSYRGYEFTFVNIVLYHIRYCIADVAVTAVLKGFCLYESTMITE